jgi:hypothetical protein
MEQTQPRSALPTQAQQRTLRLAWVVLLSFFALFGGLFAWALANGWRYFVDAHDVRPSTLIMRGNADLVTWQPCGRTIFQGAVDQQLLNPCDAVRIATSAGYGQAATIELFDRSTLDLWAGTDLTLVQAETSRWNNRLQQITLRQNGGYVRYDLHADQPYQQVRFAVQVSNATIQLQPGGSYSIELRPTRRLFQVLDSNGNLVMANLVADVAVRSGRAWVYTPGGDVTQLVAQQRVEISPNGMPEPAIPARWELIADGSFTQFNEAEYNNTTLLNQPTLAKADTWQVYSGGAAGTPGGYFRLGPTCRPPQTNFTCDLAERRIAAWFYRSGGQTASFITGIRQNFGVNGEGLDISEYRSLAFSAWVRILGQSLEGTGVQGSECPVMIRFLGKRNAPTDDEHERVLCAFVEPQEATVVKAPGIIYRPLEAYNWYRITFDLRDAEWFPDYRYLRGIQIYANGHDYDVRVAELSLMGEQ